MKQDVENDPIHRDQMVNKGRLLVCIIGNFLTLVLVVAYTFNKLDLDNKDENYEIDKTNRHQKILLL